MKSKTHIWRDYHRNRPMSRRPRVWLLWLEGSSAPMGVTGEGPFVHPDTRAYWMALESPWAEDGGES